MKKLMLTLISLTMLISSAKASCPYVNPQGGDGAYCWQAERVNGAVVMDNIYYMDKYEQGYYEDLKNKGDSSSDFDWYAYVQGKFKQNLYEEDFYGIYATAEVFGFPQTVPNVWLDSHKGVLTEISQIKDSNGIVRGKKYTFFIWIIRADSAQSLYDLDAKGWLKIQEGAQTKFKVYIQ